MDAYREMKKMWKDEEFRLFIAHEYRADELEKYNERIKMLQDAYATLESTEINALPKCWKSHLKSKLEWDDERVQSYINRYKKDHRKKNTKGTASTAMKFFDALIGS